MIYIDASRYNNTDKRTGVENYSRFLISELIKKHAGEITLITPRKIDQKVKQLVIPFPRLWTQLRLSWECWRNKKINNLFVPSHVLPLIHPKRSTITIHDIAFRWFPESYGVLSRWYLNWTTRFAVRHARRIIVPSQVTKDDLVKWYKADPGKIVVIHSGHKRSAKGGRKTKNNKYFLYIGRIERKKNLSVLIDAFKKLNDPKVQLILAGKPGVGGEEIYKKAKNNKNIILPGYIDEATKHDLLQNARAFVLPSLYEGFGFPLLEAMEYNLPIIASDIPASREVAKGAALFFETGDTNALAKGMKKIIKDRSLDAKRTRLYKTILKKHSWPVCAEKTWKAL